jgi:hypothetical protein
MKLLRHHLKGDSTMRNTEYTQELIGLKEATVIIRERSKNYEESDGNKLRVFVKTLRVKMK